MCVRCVFLCRNNSAFQQIPLEKMIKSAEKTRGAQMRFVCTSVRIDRLFGHLLTLYPAAMAGYTERHSDFLIKSYYNTFDK